MSPRGEFCALPGKMLVVIPTDITPPELYDVWDAAYAREDAESSGRSNTNNLEEVTLCAIWEDVSGNTGEDLTAFIIDMRDGGRSNIDTELVWSGNIDDFVDVTLR